jgi:tRNA (mo5U34)-methyltransferase
MITQEQVDGYGRWHHSIDFGNGVSSKGKAFGGDTRKQINRLQFPDGIFKDKNVLDIGAWDGVYSFYAEKMGAKSVLALDHHMWLDQGWGSKEGFILARNLLQSRVKDIDMDIMDATPENLGTFDVIIFSGVLYHLKNPYLALETVVNLLSTGGCLIIETHINNMNTNKPIMEFHPEDSLNRDKTNYWSPNLMCLQQMIFEIGGLSITKLRQYNQDRAICYCVKG